MKKNKKEIKNKIEIISNDEVNENNNQTKKSIIMHLLFLIVVSTLGSYFYTNMTNGASLLKKYYSLLNQKNYEAMYDLVETRFK